jgi:putative pyoverdin transport system ATP-binding/permease protein
MLYLMTPLQMIMNSVPAMVKTSVAIANVTEIGLKLNFSTDGGEQECATLSRESVRLDLRNVTYSYRTNISHDAFTLGPIDLTIFPREITFILGGNGSGKTTLAKLILGLYIPEGGEILCNGVQISEANRHHFCECFSAVFSDFFVFESLLGIEKPHLDDRAREYLSRLQIDHVVTIKAGSLSNTKLSQGQRRRLALLAAFLEDRPVFVFDEWAGDQDPIFKEIFYFNILPELRARGKTVIVISHDERYSHVADRIIIMESGRVITGVQEEASSSIAERAR